jgi:hypothetical protein
MRWAINVDIEGFAATYEKGPQACLSLGALLLGIVRIGRLCFSRSLDRLFAQQLGDGCVIVGEFGENSLERPLNIATAVMRNVAVAGGAAKAAVAEGDFGDIRSCYPGELTDVLEEDGSISLGEGHLRTFQVMGTTLIRSVSYSKVNLSGPLLLVSSCLESRVPCTFRLRSFPGCAVVSVGWIHAQNRSLAALYENAVVGLSNPNKVALRLHQYLDRNEVTPTWRNNALNLISEEPWVARGT